QAGGQELLLHQPRDRDVRRQGAGAVRDHAVHQREPVLLVRFQSHGARRAQGDVSRHARGQIRGRDGDQVLLIGRTSMRRPGRAAVSAGARAAPAGAGCAGGARWGGPGPATPPWVSRAVPEARGDFNTLPDGRRQAIRSPGWTTDDFGTYRTYAYGDRRPE